VRLLASVIPPPPASLWVRVRQVWPSKVRSIIHWSGSLEGRNCFLAGLAGAGLVLWFYRSEASSAASPGDALERPGPSSALAQRASIRAEPRVLPATLRDTSSSPAGWEEPAGVEPSVTSRAVEAEHAPRAALESGSSVATQQRVRGAKHIGKRKVEKSKLAKRKFEKKKFEKKKQKAKRAAVARASSRAARRAKSHSAATPLGGWLAKQARSEGSSAAKSR
jgi:hypothetical protein